MGLQEDVAELLKIMKEDKESKAIKEKKWKYPFGKKVGKGQRKKNFITVQIINENGVVDFKKYQIIDQTFVHDTIPRLASAGYVMHDRKGNPVIILPNWSVEPINPKTFFNPSESYEKSLKDGTNTTGFRLLMARMQSEKIDAKKGIPTWVKVVIGLVIVGGLIFALVSGGGGAKP